VTGCVKLRDEEEGSERRDWGGLLTMRALRCVWPPGSQCAEEDHQGGAGGAQGEAKPAGADTLERGSS
jgi:hypothetical protein